MPSFKFISILFLGLMLSAPVLAADITDAGASALQARFTKEINSRSNIKIAGRKADFTGAVVVTPKSNYYEVVLPSVTLTDTSGTAVNVGKLVMNMIPSNDNAAEYKSALAVPSTMTYLDKTGKAAGNVTIGSQKASGIWNMDMFGFRKFDSSYSNVALTGAVTGEKASLATLNTTYDLTKSDAGFSGPVSVTATDLAFTDKSNVKADLAREIKINSQIKADKSAQGGYTQTSEALITGMDKAMSFITSKMKDPTVQNKVQLQKAFGVLTILQMSGKPTGNADTRSYNVVTKADGKTMLNGVDVSLLLGAISIQ